MLEHKFRQNGMSPRTLAAALKRFGNPDRVRNRCVEIRRRRTPLRLALKRFSILLGLTGLAIHILCSNDRVAHVGDTLIMIAISGRLLLYVRDLSRAFPPR